jgi:tetratricopeptide (TPR) repeat protein
MNRLGEAEAALRRALSTHEKLVKDFPDVSAYVVDLGMFLGNFGELVRQGNPEHALQWYAKAIRTLEPIVAREPGRMEARASLCGAVAGQALAHEQLGRHAEAIEGWKQALALDHGPRRHQIQRCWANSLVGLGKHAEAMALINDLANAKRVESFTLFRLACICSWASTRVKEDAPLQNQYAARAVELLRLAIARGANDPRALLKDRDLDPLRGRADFQQLKRDIDKKATP